MTLCRRFPNIVQEISGGLSVLRGGVVLDAPRLLLDAPRLLLDAPRLHDDFGLIGGRRSSATAVRPTAARPL